MAEPEVDLARQLIVEGECQLGDEEVLIVEEAIEK